MSTDLLIDKPFTPEQGSFSGDFDDAVEEVKSAYWDAVRARSLEPGQKFHLALSIERGEEHEQSV